MRTVEIALSLFVLGEAAVAIWLRRTLRGRHVSRWLIGRFGRSKTMGAFQAVCWTPFVSHLVDCPWGMVAATAAVGVWILDDVLTGGDDDRRRKREPVPAVLKARPPARPLRYRISTGQAA